MSSSAKIEKSQLKINGDSLQINRNQNVAFKTFK